MQRRMGLHEIQDKGRLIDFLKIGRFLGDPGLLPCCGDEVESCIAMFTSGTGSADATPASAHFRG